MKPFALSVLAGLFLALPLPVRAQEPQTCEAGFRLFDHDLLEGEPLCIPENPQRVVALEMSAAEMTLFTDKELVGTNTWVKSELPVMVPDLAGAFKNVEAFGYPADLEAVLLAKPDIILAVPGDIDVAAASKIAPVVVAKEVANENWEAAFSIWSDVLNVSHLYTEMEANYQARVAELQADLGEARKTTEVSVISAGSYGVWLWLKDTAPGKILEDVGLARPPAQDLSGEEAKKVYEDAPYVNISDERLDLADGDDIFVFNYATSDPKEEQTESAATRAFREKPLWQGLSGVKAGHAYYVGGYWWRSQTYLLANLVLDDLFEYLAKKPGEVPSLTVAGASE